MSESISNKIREEALRLMEGEERRTYRELSEMSGVPYTTLHDFLHGADMGGERLTLLARAMGIERITIQ